MKTYGRQTIYVNLTEKELLSGTINDQATRIINLLPDIISIHTANKIETEYLQDYIKGIQDIRFKVKKTREEINNKPTENWAYAFVDFKTTWQLGKPIQYVMRNDSASSEIEALNRYVRYENKKAKDLMLYEDVLTVGRGFRFTNYDKPGEADEAPFEIINVDCQNCEVIYSSKLGNEQLFSVIETEMQEVIPNPDQDAEEKFIISFFQEYTIYTRNRMFVIQARGGDFTVTKTAPIALKEHLIDEWYVNKNRISLVELGKDIFDNINYMEGLDLDDMEQFVNAIMVFTNAEVDEEEFEAIKELGAVSIKSTENKKASVELLQARLNAQDTQTFYTRLVTALHQILGVPMAGDSGSVTSGDTGKAKLTGQGFTSAGIRAERDETMIEMCDFEGLKKMIKICKNRAGSGVTTLRASDLDIKLQRDMSDNLLVKTQGLMNLLASDIPREYAVPIVNLFSDSNAVVKSMQEKFGDQVSQQGASKQAERTTNPEDLANQQSNNIVNTEEGDLQQN